MKKFLGPTLIAVVAGALGFALAKISTPSPIIGSEAPTTTDSISNRFTSSSETPIASPATQATRGPLLPAGSQEVTPMSIAEFKEEMEAIQSSGWMGLQGIRRTSKMAERLAISDLAMIARKITEPGAGGDYTMGVHFVMSAYAEQDPDAAWALALAMPNGAARQSALNAAAAGISGRDPKRAMDLAATITDPQIRDQIRMMAISQLAAKDPRGAFTLYQSEIAATPISGHDSSVSMIFHHWARRDPEAARAAALELRGPQQDQALMTILSSFTQKDPKAAWEYARSLPESNETYGDPRVRVIQMWANSDPISALDAANSLKKNSVREAAISSVVSTWSRSDFDAALNYALTVSSATQRADVFRALSANSSPHREKLLAAALDYMPPGNTFQQVVSQVFSSWANDDPATAAEAVFKLPPGRVLSNAASRVASDWVRTGNQAEVLNWVKKLPEGNTRLSSIDAVFQQLASTDVTVAQAALSNFDAAEKDRATRALAEGWSRKDPQAVLTWSRSLASEELRDDITREAMNQWANSDPEAAAQMLSQLPESVQSRAMQSVISRWANKDAASAGEWLSKQPAGQTRDGAISSLARTLAVEDPVAALNWTAKISDEKNRSRQLEQQARAWIQNEPSTAKTWVQQSTLLSDESKRKLLE